MGIFSRVGRLAAWLSVAVLVVACSDDKRAAEGAQAPKAAPKAAVKVDRVRYYDDKGNLLPSEQVVAGVTLPVGLKQRSRRERRTVFTMTREVPFKKVVAYFGPRLFTGQVEASDHEVAYLKAVPNDQLDALVKLDVRVSKRMGGETDVTLVEYSKNFAKPATPAEAQKALKEHFKTAE